MRSRHQQQQMVAAVLTAVALAVSTVAHADFGAGGADFSLAYFRHSYGNASNLVVSPLSIRLMVSVLYQAADAEAATALRQAFHLPVSKEEALNASAGFVDALDANRHLNVSFQVFKVSEPLVANFGTAVTHVFRSTVEDVVFADKAAVVARVNRWASDATDGKIRNYLGEDDIDSTAEMLLLSALTLQALWAQPFEPEHTVRQRFAFCGGPPREVAMMKATRKVSHTYGADLQAIQLPYTADSDLTMWIILPAQTRTLDEIVPALTVATLREIETKATERVVDIFLPKFTIDSRQDVKDILDQMGYGQLFRSDDFLIFNGRRSELGDVMQSAQIKVDEQGTEAAAVSSSMIKFRRKNVQFRADRPFMFIIKQLSTDSIVFLGHYSHFEGEIAEGGSSLKNATVSR